ALVARRRSGWVRDHGQRVSAAHGPWDRRDAGTGGARATRFGTIRADDRGGGPAPGWPERSAARADADRGGVPRTLCSRAGWARRAPRGPIRHHERADRRT